MVKPSFKTAILFLLAVFLLLPKGASGNADNKQTFLIQDPWENMSVDEMGERAFLGTLYYQFDEWFAHLKNKISQLNSGSKTRAKQLELMKAYFYLAGLNGEFSHVLAFSSKFKVQKVNDDFIEYSEKAKGIAQDLLNNPKTSEKEKSEVYFFLGAAKGYLGIFQYGAGNLWSALINGLQADNDLERALLMDPHRPEAYLGLGIYRYGSSRLGWLGNLILQGGKDFRAVGLDHIERSLKTSNPSRPLALKTIIWFYISEQINPDNSDLPPDNPLSPSYCRKKALEYLHLYETEYFRNVDIKDFSGNQGLAMMKAVQHALDGEYIAAKKEFQEVLRIIKTLKQTKGYNINPQLTSTAQAAIKFCELMLLNPANKDHKANPSNCSDIRQQIQFIENGGTIIEYNSKKIRREIQDIFYFRLQSLASEFAC